MSTKIRDKYTEGDSLEIDSIGDLAYFFTTDSRAAAYVAIPKDALKGALRRELGWIVIEESELPEVTPNNDQTFTVEGLEGFNFWRADDSRRVALGHLAVAEYKDAQPKIDPADLTTAQNALMEASESWMTHAQAEKIARKLLESGKIEVKK